MEENHAHNFGHNIHFSHPWVWICLNPVRGVMTDEYEMSLKSGQELEPEGRDRVLSRAMSDLPTQLSGYPVLVQISAVNI